MAEFAATVERVSVEAHPNADKLEVARVRGYTSVVPKGRFRTGNLAAYIPEGSIVLDCILNETGLRGRLAGKNADRVRALRLRGVLSQGLLYPLDGERLAGAGPSEGDDVTGALGITKYVPPIPDCMAGEVARSPRKLLHYDIEDVKQRPGRFRDGEPVVMTEKLHGTLCYVLRLAAGETYASSKGLAASDLVFAPGTDNVYTRALGRYRDDLESLAATFGGGEVHMIGEVYGRGIQDLHYGTAPDMRIFDVFADGRFVDPTQVQERLLRPYREGRGTLLPVPVVYAGAYSAGALAEHTVGQSVLKGAGCMREGIVVRPLREREDFGGRLILKSKSAEYLTRGGRATEYN